MTDDTTEDEKHEISRRLSNTNMDYPGHDLRLDLYRLLCHFYASEAIAGMSTGEHFCEFSNMRDQFERSEIIRILVNTSVAIRWAGSGHVDKHRNYLESLKRAEVGELIRNIKSPKVETLSMLEACNKIVHCEHSQLVKIGHGMPHEDFICESKVVLHSDFDASHGWKAVIDINKYVDEGSNIAGAFSSY